MRIPGYEEVHRIPCGDSVAFVALHAVVQGRAFGGVRIQEYASENEALEDALALSRAMTRKVLLAGIEGGGGKTVLRKPQNREQALRDLGDFIESLGGRYFCGPDYGFTAADTTVLKSRTRYVACADLAPATAETVKISMEAVLRPRVVAIQGLGSVGRPLADALRADGVRVIASDLRGGDVPPDAIFDVECDVFAPCATGGVLTPETVRRLRCRLVCGAANNPLASDDVAPLLGLRYVPDFIANSGATIQGASTSIGEAHLIPRRIAAVGDLVRDVMARAERENRSPHFVAIDLADERLRERRTAEGDRD